MFSKIFDLFGKTQSTEQKMGAKIALKSTDSPPCRDELIEENIATSEKTESEIWQGIKSEKEGKLLVAISHYRQAIKLEPECAEAHQLLFNALKKKRQQRQEQIENISDQQRQKVTVNSVTEVLSSTAIDSFSSDTISNGVNGGDNSDLPAAKLNSSNGAILLPDLDTSPSGEMVLKTSLAAAQLYIEQALAFFEQRQWDKSISACQEALRIYPSLAEAYKVWGNCLQQSGNSAEAIGKYAKALEIQPDMAEIYCNLGSIYAKDRKWQQALEHYRKSTIINPKNATPWRNLARVWDELGEYEKSNDCFFKAIEIEPKLLSAQNYLELANNLLEEGQSERAIACYKNCVQLEPKLLNAYFRLGQALEQNGQIEEARLYYKKLAQLQVKGNSNSQALSKTRQQIQSFLAGKNQSSTMIAAPPQTKRLVGASINKPMALLQPTKTLNIQERIAQCRQAVQQQPNSAALQMKLGNLYFRAQQWQNSAQCYLKATKIAPKQAEHYLNLGQALEKIGEPAKANLAFYRGFSLKPEGITAKNHYLLGNKLLEQKQIEPAIACYRRAISRQPDLIDAYWHLAEILLSIDNHRQAIDCYRQALKVDPHQVRSYVLLGKIFYQKQKWQPALACYQKAVELEPNNADIQHILGELFAYEQKWTEAVASFRHAITINRNHTWSYYHLGSALMELKEWQQAKEALNSFIKLKPDFYWSHHKLGDICAQIQEWDEAVAAYRRALAIKPDSTEIPRKINEALPKRAALDLEKAKKFYQQALEREPENESWYFKMLEITPDSPEIYSQLAKLYEHKGNFEQAIAFYKIALQIQPHNQEVLAALEKTKSQLN